MSSSRAVRHLDLQTFQKRLREVVGAAPGKTDTREVGILLFKSHDTVEKPIGEASKESVRAAIPLKAEHE